MKQLETWYTHIHTLSPSHSNPMVLVNSPIKQPLCGGFNVCVGLQRKSKRQKRLFVDTRAGTAQIASDLWNKVFQCKRESQLKGNEKNRGWFRSQ